MAAEYLKSAFAAGLAPTMPQRFGPVLCLPSSANVWHERHLRYWRAPLLRSAFAGMASEVAGIVSSSVGACGLGVIVSVVWSWVSAASDVSVLVWSSPHAASPKQMVSRLIVRNMVFKILPLLVVYDMRAHYIIIFQRSRLRVDADAGIGMGQSLEDVIPNVRCAIAVDWHGQNSRITLSVLGL